MRSALRAAIGAVAAAAVVAGCGSKPSEAEVWNAIRAANYCTQASECTVVESSCFSSNIVNVKEATNITRLTNYYQGCVVNELDMRDLSRLSCVGGKCVAAMKNRNR